MAKKELKSGIELVILERIRQIEVEGFSIMHDRKHENGELALAACYYAFNEDTIDWIQEEFGNDMHLYFWPFDLESIKLEPNNRIKQLTKAGALIIAEIDRLQSIEYNK